MAANNYAVTGDQYRTIDRRMREVKRQLDQDGGSPIDPEWVAHGLQQIIEAKEVTSAPLATASPFFANEEVKSNYGYPQGYAVKPVCEQLVELSKHFNGLNTSSVLACSKELPALPAGAEGWFAVPRWEKVASS